VPTVEGAWFNSLLLLFLMMFALLLVHGLLQTLALWKHVRSLLQAVAKLPMRQAYDRIPQRITRSYGPYLSSERPARYAHLQERQKQYDRLCSEYEKTCQSLQNVLGYTDEEMRQYVDAGLPDRLQRHTSAPGALCPKAAREASKQLRRAARAWLRVLERYWQSLTVAETSGDPEPAESKPAADAESPSARSNGARVVAELKHTPSPHREVQRWREAAEDFVALEVVLFLSQYFVQLRNLLVFLTVGPLLLLFAVTSYPLQPQPLWLLFAGVLIVAVASAFLVLFVQLERDELVSRISGTTPNHLNLNWSFLGNIVTYAVPLLGILAIASVDVSDLMHAWLEPILRVLK
jgi:hypothetical protein